MPDGKWWFRGMDQSVVNHRFVLGQSSVVGTQWLWKHVAKSRVFKPQQTRNGETKRLRTIHLQTSHLFPPIRHSSQVSRCSQSHRKNQKRKLMNMHSRPTVPILHSLASPTRKWPCPQLWWLFPCWLTDNHSQTFPAAYPRWLSNCPWMDILTLSDMKMNKTDPQTTIQLIFIDRTLKGAQAKGYKVCEPTDGQSQTIRESNNRGDKEM